MIQPNYQPATLDFGDAIGIGADQGNLDFLSVDHPDFRAIWTDGTTEDDYVPAQPNGKKHTLPAGAILPILKAKESWACPPAERFAAVRKLIEETSATGDIVSPGWDRMRHIVGLHLGGPQSPTTPYPETRIEWLRDNWDQSTGMKKQHGFYYGTLEGWTANGWSNWHYNRLWLMTVAIVYEPNHAKRIEAWPHYVQQAVAYASFGRVWFGSNAGQSRDEKGTTYVGDSGRFPYEKDWTLNLVGPYLLTGQGLFKKAIDLAIDFYTGPHQPTWGGAWGARIPARIIGSMLALWMVTKDPRLLTALKARLAEVSRFLDRANAIWPNIGNRGAAPESPWMQAELVAEVLRTYEQIPELIPYGPTREELAAVMSRVMDTNRGTQGGSEKVGKYALLRYRYATPQTTEPMTATHPVHTAFALPALRLLQDLLPSQYKACRDFVRDFVGSHMAHVKADSPRPLSEIGYREPQVEGPAAPKTWASWGDAVR